MAARRPIYRKRQSEPTSRKGLLFCLLLAGGVMLVPIGGDFVHSAKLKVRDLALSSGLVDLNDCVVTPAHAITCTSDAIGMPLPVALRQMEDSVALAATEKAQRVKAESAVRQLAVELERLTAQAAQSQTADRTVGFFPAFDGEVTPTARSAAEGQVEAAPEGAGGVDVTNPAVKPQATPPTGAVQATPGDEGGPVQTGDE